MGVYLLLSERRQVVRDIFSEKNELKHTEYKKMAFCSYPWTQQHPSPFKPLMGAAFLGNQYEAKHVLNGLLTPSSGCSQNFQQAIECMFPFHRFDPFTPVQISKSHNRDEFFCGSTIYRMLVLLLYMFEKIVSRVQDSKCQPR